MPQNLQWNEPEDMPDQQYIERNQLDSVYSLKGACSIHSEEATRLYRNALGRFATGVTLITACNGDESFGITVNSFASVSLNPALVLWSLAKNSGRYEKFRDTTHFAIHILAENQYKEAMDFAKNAHAFNTEDWYTGEDKMPLMKNALARFECEIEAIHDGGDHSIFTGRVLRFSQRSGQALIFTTGKFGTFAERTET